MATAEFAEGVQTTEFKRHPYPGLYIVFEGTGGTGKDTVSREIVRRLNSAYGDVVWVHEPGSTPTAEVLREILKTTQLKSQQEMELFALAREDSLPKVVQPVLIRGGIVVSGRSAFSSFAYQGFGRSLGMEAVMARNSLFLAKFIPDIVVCAERNLGVALAQAQTEYGGKDVFDDDLELNLRIQRGYRSLREMFGRVCDWIWIDNLDDSLSLEQTTEVVWEQLLPRVRDWWSRGYCFPRPCVFVDP